MRADDLVGVWHLVSFRELDGAGTPGVGPLGDAPRGRLVYTRDGHVSVHMMRGPDPVPVPGPVPVPVPYMGYAGTWRLDGARIVHRIEVTPRHDWIDTEQTREATLAGGRLTLHARTRVDGVEHRRVLVWRRDRA